MRKVFKEGKRKMKKEEKGEFKDFTDGKDKEKRKYKNKVFFLHKSKGGNHLYAFVNEGQFLNVRSIIMNINEVEALMEGKTDYAKVSIIPEEEEEDDLTESG